MHQGPRTLRASQWVPGAYVAQCFRARTLEPNCRDSNLTAPLTSLMTPVKLLNFCLPQFPYLKMGTIILLTS